MRIQEMQKPASVGEEKIARFRETPDPVAWEMDGVVYSCLTVALKAAVKQGKTHYRLPGTGNFLQSNPYA